MSAISKDERRRVLETLNYARASQSQVGERRLLEKCHGVDLLTCADLLTYTTLMASFVKSEEL